MPKLLRGDKLERRTREEVLRAFPYRQTHENARRRGVACVSCADRRAHGSPMTIERGGKRVAWHDYHVPQVSDAQWLAEHAFWVNRDGTLTARRHAEPAFLVETVATADSTGAGSNPRLSRAPLRRRPLPPPPEVERWLRSAFSLAPRDGEWYKLLMVTAFAPAHEVSFPDVTRFDDLFLEVVPDAKPLGAYLYCHVTGLEARWQFWVVPRSVLMRDIELNMCGDHRDRKSFKIIEWKNGRALVLCQSSLILATRWLAFIDPSTIPHRPIKAEETRA